MRQLSLFDKLLIEVDQSMRTVYAGAPASTRSDIPENLSEKPDLSEAERKQSASLMRVNHAGEIAAQGLYRGQAMNARNSVIKQQMANSAAEENDHLNWCEARLAALDSRKSVLSPFWYWGSFSIGALAGAAGDRWSLGFVKETEDQVGEHISRHLEKLPEKDKASRSVLLKMQADEKHHAEVAEAAGAAKLPFPIRKILMPLTSKVMTGLSARI